MYYIKFYYWLALFLTVYHFRLFFSTRNRQNSLKKSKKLAVVMGNEGQGISEDIKKELDKNVYINMNDDCESLNVAVASSIIMYEINKKLKGE